VPTNSATDDEIDRYRKQNPYRVDWYTRKRNLRSAWFRTKREAREEAKKHEGAEVWGEYDAR
jgi:hypothetical protein